MQEVWKDINGYEGYYQVSSLGRVKSVKRMVNHNYGGLKIVNERVMSQRTAKYKNLMLCKEGEERIFWVHRLVAESFIENPDNKPEVNHKDANCHNNNVDNLEWATRAENQIHAVQHDLFKTKYGKNPYKNRDLAATFTEIRSLYKEKGVRQKEIAKTFSIDQSTVSRIFNNKRWTTI
jgi:DNA-binding transcriptional regulator YiaG